jgi:DNA gyrase inhibitor GyrI
MNQKKGRDMADTPAPEKPKRRRTTKTAAAKPAKAKATSPAKAEGAAKPAPTRQSRPPSVAKKSAAKPRTTTARKPAAPKPAKPARTAVVAPAVEKAVETVKRVVADVPPRTGVFAAIGTAAVVAGAFFVWRASRAEEPRYQTVESDNTIEVRKYPSLVTAGTEHRGERQAALTEGFRALADYLFAKSRAGARLPMTAPVLSDTDGDGSWRTRFVMPTGKARAELPKPPAGVELMAEPARRVAVIRFSGRADDATLAAKEGALRSWLQIRGLPSEGRAVHAYYNAPFLPGPMRRNEVMIVLSDEGGTGA